MLLDARQLLLTVKKNHTAIAALNTSSWECTQAIFAGAAAVELPVIVSTSEGESKHVLPEILVGVCAKLADLYKVDYVLHLDHGKDQEWMQRCLDAGYNSIHMDYSELPLEENIEKTARAREITRKYNVPLEGEVGIIPYNYYAVTQDVEFTDPAMAKRYVEATDVDSLAVSVGTEHGWFKRIKELNIPVLEAVSALLPNLPLVMHGGSLLPTESYLAAIANGIAKINICAELRMAYTKALKENIQNKPDEYAPYRLLKGVKEAMQTVAETKLKLFAKRSM